jgi:hypothetical protein
MVVYYCDLCGKKLDNDNIFSNKLNGIVQISVTVSINNILNKGRICKDCFGNCLKEVFIKTIDNELH